jgi:lipoprotein-anchoring transpeptidase ErfK/SrfK
MKIVLRILMLPVATVIAAASAGCTATVTNTNTTAVSNTNTTSNANTATAKPANSNSNPNNVAVTLPLIDAMFAEENFANDLKSRVQLTDEQVAKLKNVAREATSKLREGDAGAQYQGTTAAARAQAEEQIKGAIGPEKAPQLVAYVSERYSGAAAAGSALPPPTPINATPSDTRIVVNAPAFRMDVFQNGQLVKTYKVSIGYPEFPLPTGMRKAETIIFNPTWTPPDEPWVEAPGSKVKVGETVKAGDKLNPLGPIKIPIGLPSLIHGGKVPARINNFGSHGCVGLTNSQVKDFAKLLAQMGGAAITDAQIAEYEKNKTETENVKLSTPVLVELRYDTIRVEDGKLYIYRDVYDKDTNSEENLRAVLQAAGVQFEQLSENERAQVLNALKEMARDPSGKLDTAAGGNANSNLSKNSNSSKKADNSNGRVTRTIKGQKEVVIEIAALRGKGYPAPVNLDAGTGKQGAAASKPPSTKKKQ